MTLARAAAARNIRNAAGQNRREPALLLITKEAVIIFTASFVSFRDYLTLYIVTGQGASPSTNISFGVVVETVRLAFDQVP